MMRKTDLLALIVLTTLGLLLRLWHINADLWLDEILTLVDYLRLPPFEAISGFNAPNQHFLNSFLGSISIRLFGESTWAIRLPALLFGVATIPAMFFLARMVTGQRQAIFSTLFLTLSYHHVWFSQNARGYSAMIFFTVISTILLLRWLNHSGRHSALTTLGFVICSCLGILSLLNYAFLLAGQCVAVFWILLLQQDTVRIRQMLYAGLFVLVLSLLSVAPVLPEMVEHFASSSLGISNLDEFVFMLLSGLSIGLAVAAVPVIVIGGLVVVVGCVSYWRTTKLIVLLLFLAPLFNIVALIVLGFGWYPRSFLYVLPFGILIMMRGCFVVSEVIIARLKSNPYLVYVLPSLLLFASSVMLTHNYRYPKQDYSGSLAYAQSQAAEEDVIAVVGYLSYGFRHHYAPQLEFPSDLEQLENLRGPNHRVWVLYSFSSYLRAYKPEIYKTIKTEYSRQKVFPGTLGDGDVFLYVAAPKPAN